MRRGAMCIRTNRGALRLEQQLTGQSVLVPQGGDVFLANGQIDSLRTGTSERCSCELQAADVAPPPPEVSQMATAEEVRHKVEDVKPNIPTVEALKPTAPKEEPIYQVFVPPLIFDAKAKVQPEVDPENDCAGTPSARASHVNFSRQSGRRPCSRERSGCSPADVQDAARIGCYARQSACRAAAERFADGKSSQFRT